MKKGISSALATGLVLAAAVLGYLSVRPTGPTAPKAALNKPANTAKLRAAYVQMPLAFEANEGQRDERVQFFARGSGYAIFLTRTETVLSLQNSKHESGIIRLQLRNADPAAEVTPLGQLGGKSNYSIATGTVARLKI